MMTATPNDVCLRQMMLASPNDDGYA